MRKNPFSEVESATLEQLMARFPDDWKHTGEAMVAALESGRTEGAARFLERFHADAMAWRERVRRGGGNPHVEREALPYVVRAQMAKLALATLTMAAATGHKGGTVRLGQWSGRVIQRLLFESGLRRKPVSMTSFRLWWPLVFDRRLLMPLVQPRGIWCFYSQKLVEALAGLIGTRPCVELAAGDGTLARFLRGAGAQVTATDDHSWSHMLQYPADVERLEAREALHRHAPRAVLCSWPPPGNRFERAVFSQPQVEIYIVLLSRHRFASGAWDAYQEQQAFDRVDDLELSRLVLPPEIDPAVLVFRRR